LRYLPPHAQARIGTRFALLSLSIGGRGPAANEIPRLACVRLSRLPTGRTGRGLSSLSRSAAYRQETTQQDQSKPSYTRPLVIAIALLVAILGTLYLSVEDRLWQEYIDAGDRAIQRGNCEWAQKMLQETLQSAQTKYVKDPLVAHTHAYLKRLEIAQKG